MLRNRFSPRLVLAAVGAAATLCATPAAAPAQEPAKALRTTTPAPREGNWMKMHESFLKRARDKERIDLVFLGDSITQGWGHNDTWKRFYGPRHAANFGIGGDRTEHVLWRIEHGEFDVIRPKVVVLMIGTNNTGGESADDIAAGVTAIVKQLRRRLPEAKILLLGVFPRSAKPTDPVRGKIEEINSKISKLDDGHSVTYLDIGKSFLEPDGTLTREVMPDLLHLSARGYRIWADAMEPTLWRLLDKPQQAKK
ncbi:GDSL-like Lipase/Acylhydrolase [Aquisphaera giovannonii]|uniref:GDSL-like Lipase/Acylhydrolase n=1 Tax=Aquisphaera giovannonii TaxID=406548 RepID=A0A5B9W0E0_9BACT|nr:platelet-activating factor acetylhydrolase IB subunit [Aquisphaera giovannonii]QEH34018.1 GDSL-like Lipase/Acylhydrolase [Aquisphaera giovannonii]